MSITDLSRRDLIGGALSVASLTALGCASPARRAARDDAPHLPRPTRGQLAWQNAEVGCIFHYDMTSFREFTDSGHSRHMPVLPAETWNPTELNTDQWIDADV